MKYLFDPIRFVNHFFVATVTINGRVSLIERKARAQINDLVIPWQIFDAIRVMIISGRHIWVGESAIHLTSLPLWLPSISIAHRKLII